MNSAVKTISTIAVEPNPAMHGRLRRAARQHGVLLDVRQVPAERTDLPDASAEVVVSSLVLCTVKDVAEVLAEVRRVLARQAATSPAPASTTASAMP